MKNSIPHNALVLVADASKAIFLRNLGTTMNLKLSVVGVVEAPPNPPTHLQGTDRPGKTRTFGRHSEMETTDWHALAERRFAAEIAQVLELTVDTEPVGALVVIAAPRTLSELRRVLPETIRSRITAELDRDLTKHTVAEIEHVLS